MSNNSCILPAFPLVSSKFSQRKDVGTASGILDSLVNHSYAILTAGSDLARNLEKMQIEMWAAAGFIFHLNKVSMKPAAAQIERIGFGPFCQAVNCHTKIES